MLDVAAAAVAAPQQVEQLCASSPHAATSHEPEQQLGSAIIAAASAAPGMGATAATPQTSPASCSAAAASPLAASSSAAAASSEAALQAHAPVSWADEDKLESVAADQLWSGHSEAGSGGAQHNVAPPSSPPAALSSSGSSNTPGHARQPVVPPVPAAAAKQRRRRANAQVRAQAQQPRQAAPRTQAQWPMAQHRGERPWLNAAAFTPGRGGAQPKRWSGLPVGSGIRSHGGQHQQQSGERPWRPSLTASERRLLVAAHICLCCNHQAPMAGVPAQPGQPGRRVDRAQA